MSSTKLKRGLSNSQKSSISIDSKLNHSKKYSKTNDTDGEDVNQEPNEEYTQHLRMPQHHHNTRNQKSLHTVKSHSPHKIMSHCNTNSPGFITSVEKQSEVTRPKLVPPRPSLVIPNNLNNNIDEKVLFSPTYDTDNHTIQDNVAAESEEEDNEEPHEFTEPFQFIKTLPPPSCQPPRPSVLPKKTRSSPPITLVLDLDETLVHCNTQAVESADVSFPVMFNGSLYTVSGNLRPHCLTFLKECSELFEVVLFTASQKIYADQLANIIDPQKTFFKYRLFRDSCTFVHGNYIKDLRVLGRDLSKTIIVDNSPQAFGYQLSNGIPIKSWYEDLNDTELMKVLDFLKSLNVEHIPDVRPLIKKTFNLEAQIFGANEERLN